MRARGHTSPRSQAYEAPARAFRRGSGDPTSSLTIGLRTTVSFDVTQCGGRDKGAVFTLSCPR